MKKYILIIIFFALFTLTPSTSEATHTCISGYTEEHASKGDNNGTCKPIGGGPSQPGNTTLPVKTTSMGGAVEFKSLSGLEGLGEGEKAGLVSYINILFTLFITVSTMLAVLFIAIAGVKYMATDLIGVKESAKGDIYSALIGLLLILSSVIILETINPCIVNFNLLENGQGIKCSVKD